jgi:hypothetical protein
MFATLWYIGVIIAKRKALKYLVWVYMFTLCLYAEHHYTNALIKSDSPYLQQHAHNPVDWYPWGKVALEKAKKENKLIFLSIGYTIRVRR